LGDFNINWGRRRKAYNTELSVYFIGPEPHMSQTFGFEHEIMLVISDFDSVQPRTMQAIDAILNDDPARGRVDQTIFFLVSKSPKAKDWVSQYVSINPRARLAVVFYDQELRTSAGNAWYVRNVIGSQLFSRDLFDYQLPVDNDLFFFGRDAIVAEYLDAIRRSENRGLFGLRKVGKGLQRFINGNSLPDIHRLGELTVCSSRLDYESYTNVMNRCFVEPIDLFGKKSGNKRFFWNDLPAHYPDYFKALKRVRLYRIHAVHLEMQPTVKLEYDQLIDEDFEGRRVDEVEDSWFVLQQIQMDELLTAIISEINRYT
jgi:hypothetical protein